MESSSIPQLGDVSGFNFRLNGVACGGAVMPPSYDLILMKKGRLHIKTVQVSNADEAWRLGRELHPNCIRGVVRHERSEAQSAESS